MKIDTMKLKQLNTELVKNELINQKTGTKNSLSILTGLSIATCGNILSELLEADEVIEIENASSTGGRRSRQFKYNRDYAHIAVLYARIEGTEKSLYTAVFNMSGENLYEKYSDFDDITLNEIDQSVSEMIANYEKIRIISIGIPGIVHRGVIDLCDLKGLEDSPVDKYLSEKYNRTVISENDVNSAVLGYFRRDLNNKYESIVYLYFPEYGNPGAGILINGKILRGKSDFAGEISFLPVSEGRNSQSEIQRDLFNFTDYVVKIIRTVNAVLDPEIIVLTGRRFTPAIREKISIHAEGLIPPGHLPLISFEEDLHESFTEGLKSLAFDNMGCGFKLVEK